MEIMRPLRRIVEIDKLIRERKCPAKDRLALKFGVDERTIYRDFKALKDVWEAPIGFDSVAGTYYYIEPTYFLPALSLSEREIFSLLLSDMLMSQYRNTPYEERLRSAFEKLEQFLPEDEYIVDIGRFRESCSFDPGFVRKVDPDLFEYLIRAISEREQLEIYYYTITRDETKWRVIDPYYMKNYRGEWYLIAYCRNSNEIRNFSPVRIRDKRKTGKHFIPEEGFSSEDYWKRAFGLYRGREKQHVVVRIDEYQSRWIRELKFDTEEEVVNVEDHEDGSMTVTFSVEHTGEIKRWIMQYGRHMEVLEPEGFREEIKGEIKKMGEIYGI